MAMMESVRNSLRTGELRKRLLYTLGMLLIFRLGTHIPVPGIDAKALGTMFSGGLFSLLDMFSGGAFQNFAIFAMSISPYITASIIMQLMGIVIPKLEELQKEGEEGRKLIAKYTRYLTVVLAAVQAFGISVSIRSAFINPGALAVTISVLTLVAGTMFLLWLGEQITEKGIGNGVSLLIFVGIISRLPAGLRDIYHMAVGGMLGNVGLTILKLVGLLVITLAIIAGIVLVQEATRRVPIQYTKRVVGRRIYGGQATYLPIKINQAGVIPVIFGQSLLMFPYTIAQFFDAPWARTVQGWFASQNIWYLLIYTALIIGFTFFYTSVTFNPVDVANNIKKNGGFIPGFRPGKPTSDFLQQISNRVTVAGSVFLAAVAILPQYAIGLTGIKNAAIGGTGMIIVVGVALETMKQIEAHLVMRQYQSFMK